MIPSPRHPWTSHFTKRSSFCPKVADVEQSHHQVKCNPGAFEFHEYDASYK